MTPIPEGVRAYVPWPDRPREPLPPTLRERIRRWWRGKVRTGVEPDQD